MWNGDKLIFIALLLPLLAHAFNPGNMGADSLLAFNETESSFELPGLESLDEADPGLPGTLIAISFSSDDNPHNRSPGLISEEAKAGEYTYAEVCGDGGTDDFRIDAFTGLEIDKFDVLARYFEGGYYGDVSPIRIRNRKGQFGIMYSDAAGATLGMNGLYLARHDIPSDTSVRYDWTDIDSGGLDLEYSVNVWNNTKLSSRLGGAYSVYQMDTSRSRDYYLSAELGFSAFLWADNLSRAKFTVAQDTLNLREERNLEALYGDISLNNDIPLTDWMNLGLGFTHYMYKTDELISRDYGYGVLHFQIGRRTGVYVQYSPKFSIPVFQELYLDKRFIRISETLLVRDTYFSVEAGITERLFDNLSAGISVYQTRSRSYPVMSDYQGEAGLEYRDAGRVLINGGSAEYTIELFDFVSNSGYYSIEDAAIETTGAFPPYTPRDRAGVELRFYYQDRFSVEATLKRSGKRLYQPGAYLPAVHTLGAKGMVKLVDGLEVYIQSENIGDERYELIRGIPAPGRTLSLGARLIL